MTRNAPSATAGMTNRFNFRRLGLQRSALLVAAVLQLGCAMVFVVDVFTEWQQGEAHTWVEASAVLALIVGAALAVVELRKVKARNHRVERELDMASGAFQKVIEQHFDTWGLSKAERDVAMFAIKGMSVADIARLRDTREGTVKAQNTAIYRKAGVNGRAELISVMIEDLIAGLKLPEDDA